MSEGESVESRSNVTVFRGRALSLDGLGEARRCSGIASDWWLRDGNLGTQLFVRMRLASVGSLCFDGDEEVVGAGTTCPGRVVTSVVGEMGLGGASFSDADFFKALLSGRTSRRGGTCSFEFLEGRTESCSRTVWMDAVLWLDRSRGRDSGRGGTFSSVVAPSWRKSRFGRAGTRDCKGCGCEMRGRGGNSGGDLGFGDMKLSSLPLRETRRRREGWSERDTERGRGSGSGNSIVRV